jgi:hypothetical protein
MEDVSIVKGSQAVVLVCCYMCQGGSPLETSAVRFQRLVNPAPVGRRRVTVVTERETDEDYLGKSSRAYFNFSCRSSTACLSG